MFSFQVVFAYVLEAWINLCCSEDNTAVICIWCRVWIWQLLDWILKISRHLRSSLNQTWSSETENILSFSFQSALVWVLWYTGGKHSRQRKQGKCLEVGVGLRNIKDAHLAKAEYEWEVGEGRKRVLARPKQQWNSGHTGSFKEMP